MTRWAHKSLKSFLLEKELTSHTGYAPFNVSTVMSIIAEPTHLSRRLAWLISAAALQFHQVA
eukprot:4962268-Prymnesium_polylepis.1